MAGIKKLVGFDVATGSFLLTDVRHYNMKKHEVERLLDLVDYSGKRVPLGIYPSREDNEKIEEILNGKQYRNLITVAPGSQRPENLVRYIVCNSFSFSFCVKKLISLQS